VRVGFYFRNLPDLTAEARSVGIGYTWKPIAVDLSYISFLPTAERSGSVPSQTVTSTEFTDIDYTPFTTDRIMLTASVSLPRLRESLAKIEYVEMLGEIFTAARQVYAFRPVGKARVRNISAKPIDAKISFYIDDIMNSPTETKPYRIGPDEILEIPFYAVLDERVTRLRQVSVFDGTVFVHAEVAADYDDSYQTRVLVRGRNDWDGDVLSLRYFATPADPEILKFTRGAVDAHRKSLDSIPGGLQNFQKAGVIFDDFAGRLTYVHDPMTSRDYVQYPSETLALRGGDCDDMAVCYATLLMSIGVPTAFVDVIPPEDPQKAHVYMMFDTGLEAKEAPLVSSNPKRYTIRKNEKGEETVWIPVETTAIKKGFEEAWSKGAEEFYEDTEVRLGILKGWMRVVDLPSAL
jgi:hypothetical protein